MQEAGEQLAVKGIFDHKRLPPPSSAPLGMPPSQIQGCHSPLIPAQKVALAGPVQHGSRQE